MDNITPDAFSTDRLHLSAAVRTGLVFIAECVNYDLLDTETFELLVKFSFALLGFLVSLDLYELGNNKFRFRFWLKTKLCKHIDLIGICKLSAALL